MPEKINYHKAILPYLRKINKAPHELTTEDTLNAYIEALINYQKDRNHVQARYEAALNTDTSLPLKESYTVEEIADFYDRHNAIKKEIEEQEEVLENLKKARQECKKRIGEYLPEGLSLRWTSQNNRTYEIEHLPKEYETANIPNIKVTEVE